MLYFDFFTQVCQYCSRVAASYVASNSQGNANANNASFNDDVTRSSTKGNGGSSPSVAYQGSSGSNGSLARIASTSSNLTREVSIRCDGVEYSRTLSESESSTSFVTSPDGLVR